MRTASFTKFDGQEASLRAQGIRIYGPGSSASQDFEPEYIAISKDSRTAYVTLQENNAIAEIDIKSAQVTALRPLGFKDYRAPPQAAATYEWNDRPVDRRDRGGTEAAARRILGPAVRGCDRATASSSSSRTPIAARTASRPASIARSCCRSSIRASCASRSIRRTAEFELTEQIELRARERPAADRSAEHGAVGATRTSRTTTRCRSICAATCCRSIRSAATSKASPLRTTARSGWRTSIGRRSITSASTAG